MLDKNNILLVTDFEDIAKTIIEKLVLLRNSDRITVCNHKNVKRILENSMYSVVILHETDNENQTIKTITNIKTTKSDSEVLLLLNELNSDLILKAYDAGIFDYFTVNSEEYDILIKTVNCFKIRAIKEINERNEKFLYQQGVIDNKTNLYQHKYLKEIFLELSENIKIQNGIFCILTLDEATKTKISINRLATTIKSFTRTEDIVAVGKMGKYYIIIPNIDINGAKEVLNKIQDKMGSEFKLRAGLSKIGVNSFDTLEKNSQDGLTSAIVNDVMTVCLEDNIDVQNAWLEDDESTKTKKNYKLFKSIFTNKLDNVITPQFYRHKKSFETKLTNTTVSQYSNNIESVFSLKNENLHSELVIRYNGYAKFKIEIIHSGLDSAENTKMEIPLKELTDKLIISLLKKLKEEYKQYAYPKGNDNA